MSEANLPNSELGGCGQSSKEQPQVASVSDNIIQLGETVPVFARDIALRQLGGEEALLEEVLDSAIQDFLSMLIELNSAHQSGVTADLRRILHTLKGLAGSVGAKKLEKFAAGLESLAKSERYEDVFDTQVTLAELVAEFIEARNSLR